jgi:multiple sugar transport system substrate-binding protein
MISKQHPPLEPGFNQTGNLSRRNFLQRAAALGLGSSAALMLLNACGNPLASSGTNITFWNLFTGGDGSRMVGMENGFSASQHQIQLESVTLAWGAPYYTKLAMAAAGGRAPDVAISHVTRVPIYAAENLLDPFDLDELAKVGITEDKFLAPIWQRAFYKDKLYCVPLDTHPFVLYYNIDICKKAGLLNDDDSLKPLESPEALIDAFSRAKQVTGTMGLAAEAGSITAWRVFYTLYSQLGGTVLTEDGKSLAMDDDKAVQVLTFMSDLTLKSKVASPLVDAGGAVALFGSGQAGFLWDGEWEVTTFQAEQNLTYNMVPFPKLYDTYRVQADSHSFVLPHQLAVNPESRAAALEFISYMLKTSQDWAKGGHIPAYLPVTDSDAYKQLKPQSNYASVAADVVFDPTAWFSGSGSELENQAGAAFQGVFTGQMTPIQGLKQFQAAIQKLLDLPPFLN